MIETEICIEYKCAFGWNTEEVFDCYVLILSVWLFKFFLSPFIVPPVLLQTISTLMSLINGL